MLVRHYSGWSNKPSGARLVDLKISETNLIVRLSNGLIYTAGLNSLNQLMRGDSVNSNVLVRATQIVDDIDTYGGVEVIEAGPGIIHLSYNGNGDGITRFVSVGNGTSGQIGLGNNLNRTSVEPIVLNTNGDKIRIMRSQSRSTFISLYSGLNYSTGHGLGGGLGIGSYTNVNLYTPCSYSYGHYGPFNNRRIKKVSGGYESLQIVCEDKSMWACGYNYSGQTGYLNITGLPQVTEVPLYGDSLFDDVSQGGVTFITFARNHNTWLACGGRISDNAYAFNVPSAVVGANLSSRYSAPILPCVDIEYPDVQAVSTGYAHSIYRKQDGTLWGCGYNSLGQLGNGSIVDVNGRVGTTRVLIPAEEFVVDTWVSNNSNAAICESGNLYAWGDNTYGQLGVGVSSAIVSTPLLVIPPEV